MILYILNYKWLLPLTGGPQTRHMPGHAIFKENMFPLQKIAANVLTFMERVFFFFNSQNHVKFGAWTWDSDVI